MKKFVTVAVKTVYIADKPYTYEVPSNAFVEVGSLVRVPFGKGNKTCDGVVLSVFEDGEKEGVKLLASVYPFSVGESGVKLAIYIKSRYFCSLFDAFRLLTPSFSETGSTPVFDKYAALSENFDEKKVKSDKQKKVVASLSSGEKSLEALVF